MVSTVAMTVSIHCAGELASNFGSSFDVSSSALVAEDEVFWVAVLLLLAACV